MTPRAGSSTQGGTTPQTKTATQGASTPVSPDAPVSPAAIAGWVSALDAVIDELHDDLVRRAIVHLTALRDDLVLASRDDS